MDSSRSKNRTKSAQFVSLPEYILKSASLNKNKIAVADNVQSLTYVELCQRAWALAEQLTSAGVKPNDCIAYYLDRSVNIAIAPLAIMMSGGVFVPLDPQHPADRTRSIVTDANAKLVLTEKQYVSRFDEFNCQPMTIDTPFQTSKSISDITQEVSHKIKPKDHCYVMFTSGTTGRPKGVAIRHESISHCLYERCNYPGCDSDFRALAITTVTFDPMFYDIFMPLMVGAFTYIVDDHSAVDPNELMKLINNQNINFMYSVPARWKMLFDSGWKASEGFTAWSGGDTLSSDLAELFWSNSISLWNSYGPTETTISITAGQVAPNADTITIGRKVNDGVELYVLNDQQQPVGVGEVGELYVGGIGVGDGYLNRPEETAKSFIQLPAISPTLLYRTGDLVRLREDQCYDFLGRADSQVKMGGLRIELQEIEQIIRQVDKVNDAVVATKSLHDKPTLVAYIVSDDNISNYQFRHELGQTLPDYMIPSHYVFLKKLPLNSNGKVDRKALPMPGHDRPDLDVDFIEANTPTEKLLVKLWSEQLRLSKVGIADNFFDLGGTSILAMEMTVLLKQKHQLSLPVVKVFERQNIKAIAEYIDADDINPIEFEEDYSENLANIYEPIAVVGLSCRLPGANNVEEFWQNLIDGKEAISRFTAEEIGEDYSYLLDNKHYIPARGVVEAADCFDAKFFSMSPREAEVTDPQQRLLLQQAYHALEDAGIVPGDPALKTGVFAGTSRNTYLRELLQHAPDLVNGFGQNNVTVATEKDYSATRISHKLNLTGPSLNIQTACSTSLVAIHQAIQSLRLHECSVALAGGATVNAPLHQGYEYNEGGMYSADGHCKPFSDQASGTIFSDGVGMVVLRRLSDAQKAGDRIYAVIKGSAINNDGANKMSFSAPSVQGQINVITSAQQNAGVDPAGIDYIEAHGTGTPLGDPIEVEALTAAFHRKGRLAEKSCALGSAKSNMGHLNAAAGVTGFIKSTLSLYHGKVPATLHYKKPNPQIDFSQTPFFVANKCWPLPDRDRPRRIGVSALGIGGTNAHIILEENKQLESSPKSAQEKDVNDENHYLLLLSAKKPDALLKQREQLIDYLQKNDQNLSDVAFTLYAGRQHFSERQAVVVNKEELFKRLAKPSPVYNVLQQVPSKPVSVGLMFPGQGAQHPNMGIALYKRYSVYRDAIDECHDILQRTHSLDLKASLYPTDDQHAAAVDMLNQTRFTQPAIFSTSYATAKLLLSIGVQPSVMLGHSVGEFVAAHLSNIFTLDEALNLVATRGAMMQALPTGSMLSVRLDEKALSEKLVEGSVIATINGPDNCVAAGPDDAISLLKTTLEKADVSCRSLLTSHAFHSPMMDPIVEPFAELVKKCSLGDPTQPIMSTVTGQWLTKEQAKDPMYWACHLREPVRFFDAVSTLWQEQEVELVECGPRATCTTLAKTSHTWLDKNLEGDWPGKNNTAYSTLGNKGESDAEQPSLLLTIGHLWAKGIDVDLKALFVDAPHQKVSLPGYPFSRDKHWFTKSSKSSLPQGEPVASTENSVSYMQASLSAQQMPPQQTSSHQTLSLQATTTNLAGTPETNQQENVLSGNPIMSSRIDLILEKMADVLEKTSGIEIKDYPSDTDFIDIGLDSLLLTEAALSVRKAFKVDLSFRQLLQEFSSPQLLAEHLDNELPESEFSTAAAVNPEATSVNTQSSLSMPAMPAPDMSNFSGDGNVLTSVLVQQIQLMQQQLQMLLGQTGQIPTTQPVNAAMPTGGVTAAVNNANPQAKAKSTPEKETEKSTDKKKAFGAQAKIERSKTVAFTPKQQKAYESFKEAYLAKTAKSRASTEENRPHLADPRVVTGFNPDVKDLVYNLVSEKSDGAHIWDIDGNQYIDLVGGFGCGYMGHRHPVVVDAMKKQLDAGYEIGPQHILAGKVAKQFCRLTNMERATFCNTGSEAVMGAMRLARTVTGKSKIVTFTGDYHGIFDEVIVRSNSNGRVFPAASGILPQSVDGAMVVAYGDPNALDIIRDNIDDIAAIMIEPIQSRSPTLQPVDFVKALREIATEADIPMIFDEVITGFRLGMGGAQEFYGVKADIATYGKVIGGGMPIGAIAGQAKYLDALDGGAWEYGDDSVPEVGVTYFAGTFVRHPLVLAAMDATLTYLEENGEKDLKNTNRQTEELVNNLNAHFSSHDFPIKVVHFASLFRVEIDAADPIPALFFYRLAYHGLHLWHGRNLFLSVAHTDDHVKVIYDTFIKVADEMVASGFLNGKQSSNNKNDKSKINTLPKSGEPPVPNAKLGKDPQGNPAWYIPDPDKPGAFKKVADA